MPKEITHWLIASRVADRLHGTVLGDAAKQNPNSLRLGAVFHDALFYYRALNNTDIYLAVGDTLHGYGGEDTYSLVRHVAGAADRDGPITSFLVGTITHIFTDRFFHPLVYNLTGDYYSAVASEKTQAVSNHRHFESLMDLYFAGSRAQLKKFSLNHYIKHAEMPLPELLHRCLKTFSREKNLPALERALIRAYSIFALMQKSYTVPLLIWLLYELYSTLPDSIKEIAALYYLPNLQDKLPAVSSPVLYPDPVSGEKAPTALEQIFDMAVEHSLTFCKTIEQSIAAGNPPLIDKKGPPMDFSQNSGNVPDKRFVIK